MSRWRQEGTSLCLLGHVGKGSLLVVQPVDEEGHVIDWHGGTKRDVGKGVNRSRDEETEAASLLCQETVAPESADPVFAVGQ